MSSTKKKRLSPHLIPYGLHGMGKKVHINLSTKYPLIQSNVQRIGDQIIEQESRQSKNKDKMDANLKQTQQTSQQMLTRSKTKSLSSISSQNSTKCTEWEQLLLLCKQDTVLPFECVFKHYNYKKLDFLDSGTYSIVFFGQDIALDKTVVFKAIRIMTKETTSKFYCMNTKGYETFTEVIPEIATSIALSNLHKTVTDKNGLEYYAHCFPQLYLVSIVFGEVPNFFYIHRWNTDKYKGKPVKPVERFICNPAMPNLYLIMKMKHGGESIWSLMQKTLVIKDQKVIQGLSAMQLESLLLQMIFALGTAEALYEFEHRDLHICNVLVKPTKKIKILFRIASVDYAVCSYGVKLCIIDNTFSRMKYQGQLFFTDLNGRLNSIGEGSPPSDPQEFAYYLMYQACNNNWEEAAPQTNLYWLRYFAQELNNSRVIQARENTKIRKHLSEISDMMMKVKTICELIKTPKMHKFRTIKSDPKTSSSHTKTHSHSTEASQSVSNESIHSTISSKSSNQSLHYVSTTNLADVPPQVAAVTYIGTSLENILPPSVRQAEVETSSSNENIILEVSKSNLHVTPVQQQDSSSSLHHQTSTTSLHQTDSNTSVNSNQ